MFANGEVLQLEGPGLSCLAGMFRNEDVKNSPFTLSLVCYLTQPIVRNGVVMRPSNFKELRVGFDGRAESYFLNLVLFRRKIVLGDLLPYEHRQSLLPPRSFIIL